MIAVNLIRGYGDYRGVIRIAVLPRIGEKFHLADTGEQFRVRDVTHHVSIARDGGDSIQTATMRLELIP